MKGFTNFYLLAIPADEDWTDPELAGGKAYGTLKDDGDALQLDASIYAHLDSFKDRKTLERLANAVKDEMRKIGQEDKQARFDELVDKIAAEHREPCKTKKLPDWYEDLGNSRICIVFNEPFEYGKFRAEFSDVLLLPSAHDVYAMHPEIAENKWPVVIRAERCGVVKMTWSIAQSDYRKRRTISGLEWFEYDELKDYEQVKYCNNEHCWFVAREMRGKNAPAPGEKMDDENDKCGGKRKTQGRTFRFA